MSGSTPSLAGWLPAARYAVPETGVWAPATSTLNWCEEDYYMTPYVAEFINTVTNAIFVMLAIKGIRNCIDQKHDTIFLLTFVGYLIVGLGSLLFHGTLTYGMQLVDELAMIYTTALMFYATFEFGQTARTKKWLAASLVSLCVFITGYYHYIQDPMFHQVAYGLLTVAVIARGLWVIETTLNSTKSRKKSVPSKPGSESNLASTAASDSADSKKGQLAEPTIDSLNQEIRREMYHMSAIAAVFFLGAFLLWNVDNVFCPTLREWRHAVGMPWGFLLEGHGWWHIFSGLGAYIYIVWGILIRQCLHGRQEKVRLVWPSIWTAPTVELHETA